jgi:hypothetical protein
MPRTKALPAGTPVILKVTVVQGFTTAFGAGSKILATGVGASLFGDTARGLEPDRLPATPWSLAAKSPKPLVNIAPRMAPTSWARQALDPWPGASLEEFLFVLTFSGAAADGSQPRSTPQRAGCFRG